MTVILEIILLLLTMKKGTSTTAAKDFNEFLSVTSG